MKVYLLTSNKYTATICPINIHFLNKNWPNLDVTIVGYEDVLKLDDLPANTNVACLGNQADYGATWTDALIPFFNTVPEEYFTLIFDDHILLNEVDTDSVKIIEEQFLLKKVDKAMIGGGIDLNNSTKFADDLLVFNQDADYRLSLHPAIWTKEYFLRYLKPGQTSWQFEVENDAKFDDAVIVNLNYDYPNEPHVYSYLELYTKGVMTIDRDGHTLTNQPSSCFFDKKDIQYIWNKVRNPEGIKERVHEVFGFGSHGVRGTEFSKAFEKSKS